jgi:hypothetical protein
MSLTLAQIRTSLRRMTGNDSITLPDADAVVDGEAVIGCDTFMNRAWWAFCNTIDDLRNKESSYSIPTVVGTESYAFDNTTHEAVRQISYTDPNTGLQIIVNQKDITWLRMMQSSNTFDQGAPENYIRDGNLIYLRPIPDSIYTLRVDTIELLADNTVINGPRELGEIILNGAAWRVFSEVNNNIQKAAYYVNMEKMLTEKYVPVKQKEEDNNPTAGLDYAGRDYDL